MRAAINLGEPLILNKQSRFTDSVSSLEGDYGEDDGGTSFYSEELIVNIKANGIASVIAVSLLATGGLVASAYAVMVVQSVVVLLVGGICIINLPTVAYRQFCIAKGESVRASVNNIHREVDFLKDELDFLLHRVDDLQAEADMLIGLERKLRDIATTQGKSLKDLVDLVNENELLLSVMKRNLRQIFVVTMARVSI